MIDLKHARSRREPVRPSEGDYLLSYDLGGNIYLYQIYMLDAQGRGEEDGTHNATELIGVYGQDRADIDGLEDDLRMGLADIPETAIFVSAVWPVYNDSRVRDWSAPGAIGRHITVVLDAEMSGLG